MRFVPAAIAALAFATPLAAQDAPPATPEIEIGNIITVGAGIIYGPDYEGSDEYRLIPGAAFRADLGDISIQSRGLEIVANLIPDSDNRVQFVAGPIAGVRLNRTGEVEDERVDQLPRLDTAVELGGFAGVSIGQLTNPYDSLSLKLEAVHDVAGAHGGTIVSPVIDFSTPLSLASFASLSLSADFVTDDYADYYFSVDPVNFVTAPEIEPLRAYEADGGLKNISATLIGAYSLEGDIRSGWGIFGIVNYSRLMGSIADSPLVADVGSADQFFTGAGIGYSF